MAMNNLEDLYHHTLKDVLFAERQMLKVLPKMEAKVASDELKQGFSRHREETERHIERLEKVFETIDAPARAAKCDAMIGIIEEAEELMEEIRDQETMDAAMIGSAQAIEHYEITRYGTLVTWAKRLGHDDAAKLLGETLSEEKAADAKLTKIAERDLNAKAA